MRIAHILLDGASGYERSMQRIDQESLAASHEVVLADSTRSIHADVAHVYGPRVLSEAPAIPYVANGDVKRRRLALRRLPPPGYVVSPLEAEGRQLLPEAVGEQYFDGKRSAVAVDDGRRRSVGYFGPSRPGVGNMIDQARLRLSRFRDDIDFQRFDGTPLPVDFASLDAWIDPTTDDDDFDGLVAQALVCERPVVASRTPINMQRLENGRTGLLIPTGDANEIARAILAILFKPEG